MTVTSGTAAAPMTAAELTAEIADPAKLADLEQRLITADAAADVAESGHVPFPPMTAAETAEFWAAVQILRTERQASQRSA